MLTGEARFPKARRASVQRTLLRALIPIVLGLFAWLSPGEAHAYTWMIKHGYATCPACHADPSGGELLTAYGRSVGGSELPTRWGGEPAPNAAWFKLTRKTDAAQGADEDAEDAEEKPAKKPKKAPAADGEAEAAADAEAEADEEGTKQEGAEQAATEEGGAEASGEASVEETAVPPTDVGEGGFSSSSGFLWGLIETPEWLLLGGSFRYLNIYQPQSKTDTFRTFPMQMDLYGQVSFGSVRAQASIGGARVAVGSPYARAAQVTGAQGKDWNLISRTHWLGYDFADGTMTLRVGRMNLPFGVRMPEHTLWARQATRTDRESGQQHGVALSYNDEKMRAEVMGILGNYQINPDDFRERGYSLFFEYFTAPTTAIGVSSLITRATRDRFDLGPDPVTRHAHGVHARAGLSPKVVLLAEGNVLARTGSDVGYVGFLQADWEAVHSLHVLLTGEALDAGFPKNQSERRAGLGKPQLGAWLSLNWFFFSHFDMRIDAVYRQDQDLTLLGQLHAYL
jgi:hypothetical protein